MRTPVPEGSKPLKGRREIVYGHERFDRSEKAAQTEIATLSVVTGQPHRRDAENPRDPRLAFPLFRFCLKAWPNDPAFREAMYKTGVSYETEVRLVRVARGFHVHGGKEENGLFDEAQAEDPTAEEIEAQRATRDGLERTLERTNDVVRCLHPTRAPRALVSLCFDQEEPSIYDAAMLKDALALLSFHFGHRERRRHGA